MTRPRLLDLFCGAGGAAMGYHRAGFDVVGVDLNPQPRYPFEFHQADALTFPTEGFDAIHASPPCQHYAPVTRWRGKAEDHPDLVPAMLTRLRAQSAPWVVENVPGAPMEPSVVLCGSMFGLRVRRHRWFTFSWDELILLPACQHKISDFAFDHGGKQTESAYRDGLGCGWMTVEESREAIPPAYTEFIGAALLRTVEAKVHA